MNYLEDSPSSENEKEKDVGDKDGYDKLHPEEKTPPKREFSLTASINPAIVNIYKLIKEIDDSIEDNHAWSLAEILRKKELNPGYNYPKEERSLCEGLQRQIEQKKDEKMIKSFSLRKRLPNNNNNKLYKQIVDGDDQSKKPVAKKIRR